MSTTIDPAASAGAGEPETVESVRDAVVGWRRYLHQHPELSFHEERTAQYVADTLAGFGGGGGVLEITRPTPTSVVARLKGGRRGPVLAIRADIDALPIEEQTGLPYASTHPGKMHACGHDGHTTTLLSTKNTWSVVSA